ncbi:MAG: hypothetical protein WCA38_18250 [Candidatus Acidiferrales bacterium]
MSDERREGLREILRDYASSNPEMYNQVRERPATVWTVLENHLCFFLLGHLRNWHVWLPRWLRMRIFTNDWRVLLMYEERN